MESTDVKDMENAVPYSVIARGYDFIMSHVDYSLWSVFTNELLWRYHPEPRSVRELGCGTGTFAMLLQPLGNYDYTATDLCPEMIEMARSKAEDLPISFCVEDFSDYTADDPHDVIILLYDGLNYLTESNQLASLFSSTYNALKPGGIFFFDQSTPANSINNQEFFRDEGEMDGFSYVRDSDYDPETRLHITTFEIYTGGRTYFEQHVQRAYPLHVIKKQILKAGFEIEETFDGFSSNEATDASERIHWIVRKPARTA